MNAPINGTAGPKPGEKEATMPTGQIHWDKDQECDSCERKGAWQIETPTAICWLCDSCINKISDYLIRREVMKNE